MENKAAEEFRKVWLKQNPNIIHIPSEHEVGLMEAYALYRKQGEETPMAEAINFAEWLRLLEALDKSNGQWVLESQISTEKLYNAFKSDPSKPKQVEGDKWVPVSEKHDFNLKECLTNTAYGNPTAALESVKKLFALRKQFAELHLESGNNITDCIFFDSYQDCNREIMKALALPPLPKS